ncbi:hypothetical protein KHA96_17085 [Bacillus sp. FJAT-49711]|uniref:hypothetical protein n=1 Tax=Bacillus sp. FJAT-49711 TaxID=2833585 RepID=UPI001BC8E0B2|nr:hypothetical protein [Bacillus sp. FJAT-49711]MBS4220029.1 hypothetical protein [Bacillus sp. FJAT-49711]
MSNKPTRTYYLMCKILGLAVFLTPWVIKGLGGIDKLRKQTIIFLIILGLLLLFIGVKVS